MIKKGRGISAIMHPTGFKGGGDPDQALLKLKPDGTVDLLTGVTDYGQGGKTVLRQFAAEELGIDIDMISLHNKGTDNVTWSTDTAASRVTFIAGNAVIKAAQDFKRNLKRFAAGILNVDADDLEIDGVKIYKKDNPEIATTYADIGAASTWGGDFVVGVGAYLVPPAAPVDPITGAMDFCAAMAYAVCVADVEVDCQRCSLFHAHLLYFFSREGNGLGCGADEAGAAARVAHDVPCIVVHDHLDQNVAGEQLVLHHTLLAVLDLRDHLGGDLDVADQVLQPAVLHHGL